MARKDKKNEWMNNTKYERKDLYLPNQATNTLRLGSKVNRPVDVTAYFSAALAALSMAEYTSGIILARE
ncbi:hypothetical protein R50073_10160 [Maricurvus nonylphenolicus]